MYCGKCGAQNLEAARFCKGCGKQLGDVQDGYFADGYARGGAEHCKSCGKEVSGDANFCKNCGNFKKKSINNAPRPISNGKLFLYAAGIVFGVFIMYAVFSGGFGEVNVTSIIILLVLSAAFGFDIMRAIRR